MNTVDYHDAGQDQRLRSLYPDDPVSAYAGFPEVQWDILRLETIANGIGNVAVEELPEEVLDTIAAARRLEAILPGPTPAQYSTAFSQEFGVPVYLKREDTTAVHSFKLRGAYNKIAQLTEEERECGILAASAGNHAQGVALAAKEQKLEATIVMPKSTPVIKIKAVKELGAQVVLEGDTYSDAYNYSQKLLKVSNPAFIHPYDDPEVIAGQGTVGLEILQQLDDVTHIFVPIGGGGLISGIAQCVKELKPEVQVIGVQTVESNAMQQSIEANEIVTLEHVGTFADGVAVKEVGQLTFKLTQKYVDTIITVERDQICAAMADFKEETRSDLEPAGALSIAGMRVYAEKYPPQANACFVPICSGANASPETLAYATERAEIGRNREVIVGIQLDEKPGALRRLCDQVVDGHNITRFRYRLVDREEAHILVGFNVANKGDRQRFMHELRENGYQHHDFSDDEFVKEHFHTLGGGSSSVAVNEAIYTIVFPERTGALLAFLEALGDHWNISLFDYQKQGGDSSRVLMGFESPDVERLEKTLAIATMDYSHVTSTAASLFL